ncbi:histidine kinase [Paenibacillus sp. HB172176]|uniref:sensor histidine kinase n=1 Tax=Paenibacillus sp. HB172176 TaxID=2493690 RepID=UPI00143AEE3C|nr:histidine kinase [Paenibacillus sp. HB172176]
MTFMRRLVHLISDRSILSKLIISLFIIVFPLYAFNYMINQIAADKNREEISQALKNSVHSYNNIIDGELVRLQQMLNQSALDIAVSHVAVIHPDATYSERSDFFAMVRDNLNRIHYSTRFISETMAYLPLLDSTLSITGNGTDTFDGDKVAALSQTSQPFIEWQNKLYMTVPFITNQTNNNGMFILAVEISRETIRSYLSKIMNFERGGTLYYSPGEDWQIATHGTDSIAGDIRAYLTEHPVNRADGVAPVVQSATFQGEPYFIVSQSSNNQNTMLVAYAPESEIFGSLSIYHELFYSMSILSGLIIILFSIWLYKLIHKPLRSLVNGFRKVEIGKLDFELVHQNKDEFGYLYHRFNDMLRNLNNLINVVYEQKILNERSELKRLQSQINPHFLYNNFFVLKRLIRSGQKDKATTFADYLGRYFQFVTRNAADEISLEEDVQHARTYVDIQTVCFDQRISVQFNPVPKEISKMLVPRLILQPLLENSYSHAFERQLSEGMLLVKFHVDERYILITVEDNGKHLSDAAIDVLSTKLHQSHIQTEESTGLLNVHRRIRLKFGANSGISVDRSSLGGLRTQIYIDREEVRLDAEAANRG